MDDAHDPRRRRAAAVFAHIFSDHPALIMDDVAAGQPRCRRAAAILTRDPAELSAVGLDLAAAEAEGGPSGQAQAVADLVCSTAAPLARIPVELSAGGLDPAAAEADGGPPGRTQGVADLALPPASSLVIAGGRDGQLRTPQACDSSPTAAPRRPCECT